MNDRNEKNQPEQDRSLDIPAEANRDKHINFTDRESQDQDRGSMRRDDEETERRKKEWKKGFWEGRRKIDPL